MPSGRTTQSRRPLLLVAGVLGVVLLLAAPGGALAAAPDIAYPAQSLGDRGTDVRTIQSLLTARGYVVPVDGVYGTTTRDQVAAWQTASGIAPATGVMDARSWPELVMLLVPGASGPAVRAVQLELRTKVGASVVTDGVWGPTTTTAVLWFQRHVGTTPTGTMNTVTWRRLIAHFERPTFDRVALCDYSVGNGPANWGTSAAINMLEAAARVEAAAGHGRVAVGDIGFQHGGPIPGHQFHRLGLEIDIRPMRKARDQCRVGVNYRSSAYDRAATRELVQAIRASSPGHIKLIYFNDPVLIREGLTRRYTGHDDHLHVRYCEPGYPDPSFAC